MRVASVYEVQHNFSRVLSWVAAGETVIIRRRNIPVAKLVPAEETQRVDRRQIVEEIRRARIGIRLNGLRIRDLINEGRRH